MIFCVEDDSGIRDLMIYTLHASGFEAEGFPDAGALWEALRHTTPQLIIWAECSNFATMTAGACSDL